MDGKQVRADKSARTGRLLPPPVGTSDWARFSRTSYCVDKTLILKDLIDAESTVVLFTRPRRFGKTTTLKMIRAFYEGAAADRHARIHHRDARRFRRAWREARHPQVSAWPSTRRTSSSARTCPNDPSLNMRFRED